MEIISLSSRNMKWLDIRCSVRLYGKTRNSGNVSPVNRIDGSAKQPYVWAFYSFWMVSSLLRVVGQFCCEVSVSAQLWRG